MKHSCRRVLPLLFAGFGAAGAVNAPLRAQQPVHTSGARFVPLVSIGGERDERMRLDELLGRSNEGGLLLRSTSRLMALANPTDGVGVSIVMPEARVIRNSSLPFSMNDGPLWAGRGWNQEVTAGVAARLGVLHLTIAPTALVSDNATFQVIPFPQLGVAPRNVWANPFHPLPESVDLPLRFGNRRIRRLDRGQSSLTIDVGGAVIGAATENVWWGPGIRNAITLSNNAPGFPHLFLGTRAPRSTRVGTFDAQWIVGQLTESAYFDGDPTNDHRTVAGAAATWRPRADSAFTFGVTRLVIGRENGGGFRPGAAFDVFRSAGHVNVDTGSAVPANARDQIFSVFARWLLPSAGFESYVEWARFEEPRSFRDLVEFPGHSQGYTLGVQWAHPVTAQRAFRLQAEASYLEPDPSLRVRPVATTYTSRGVPQGFTQRGQPLGAAIGPGASSQWIAGDWFSPGWRFGPYLGRIRWDNGVLFEPIVPQFKRQDVSLFAGLRAGYSWRGATLAIDFAHAARFNYLFQAYSLGVHEETAGIDLLNNTLSMTLTTAPAWR